MSLMEFQQTHLLFDSTHLEELLDISFETFISPQTEKSNFQEQHNFSNDHFMERLLQMETEFGAELGYQENQENVFESPKFNHFNGSNDLEGEKSLFDLLLKGAKAIEASNLPLASILISKITDILFDQENEENLFNKMLFHFTQGLHGRIENDPFLFIPNFDPINTDFISTFQMLIELSPHVKFAQFTANQAILEAAQDDHEVHIVDFDIMEGIQWPPLMLDFASNGVSMRIIAIIWDPQNSDLIRRTGKRLSEFANSINLPFKFDQMVVVRAENFDQIGGGRTLIANCVINQLHMPFRDFSLVKTFLNGVSRLHPKRVVLVEEELFNFVKIPSLSFEEFISEAFEHYSALSESLQYSFSSVGLRLDGRGILGNRILDCVRKFPMERREKMIWEDWFSPLKGFKRIPISTCNVSQAKLLVGLYGKGYWVENENCRLSLSWESRPLISASVWMPRNTSTGW